MKPHTRHILATTVVLGVLTVGAAAAFVWSGAYNIGADSPHWSVTHSAIETLRERSIGAHLDGIQVPDLKDPKRIQLGALNYSAMCTGCHLAPGVDDTEIRPGLYPMPPNLTKEDLGGPKRTFWVIKHGIKLTAMPAWGKTHTDEQIWNMVAFLQKFRGMTPARYAALGGKPPAEDDDHMHEGMDGMDGMDGMGSHGASHEAGATANSHQMDAGQANMHTHADGTRESHPGSGTADARTDDGHPH